MFLPSAICFAGAVFCWFLAAVALWVKRGLLPWLFFGLGLVLVAADDACAGLILRAASPEQLVFWQKVRLIAVALIPGTWLVFSLSYSRGNHREFLRQWRWLVALAYA